MFIFNFTFQPSNWKLSQDQPSDLHITGKCVYALGYKLAPHRGNGIRSTERALQSLCIAVQVGCGAEPHTADGRTNTKTLKP